MKYRPADLIYAATTRCQCGAGMAYPRNIGAHGQWDCSAILLGEAIPKGQPGSVVHDAPLPFVFYEVRSEGQPSANGMTTRPAPLTTAEQHEIDVRRFRAILDSGTTYHTGFEVDARRYPGEGNRHERRRAAALARRSR